MQSDKTKQFQWYQSRDRYSKADERLQIALWYERTLKPTGYVVSTFLKPLEAQQAHRFVRRYFNIVARRFDTHLIWEAYYDAHKYGTDNKIHYHIPYRDTEGTVPLEYMGAYWMAMLKASANGTKRNLDKIADRIVDKGLTRSTRYIVRCERWKNIGEDDNAGTRFEYLHATHYNSIVGCGCPRRASKCRKNKCEERGLLAAYI